MSSDAAASTSGQTTFGTLSNEEKTTILFKKLMGKPSTVHTNAFFAEPGLSLQSVISSQQLWIDDFPETPEGFEAGDARATGYNTAATVDDVGVPITSTETSGPKKSNANIVKLVKLQLNPVLASNGLAYDHPLLKDTIPFNFGDGSSYNYALYLHPSRNSGKPIPFGASGGDWIVDPDAGVLTFYNKGADFVKNDVSVTHPPAITFFRYVGRKGLGGITNDIPEFNGALINGDMEVTGQVSLSGNNAGVTIGSSTVVKDMGSNNAPFIQLGNADSGNLGAWRFSVKKVGTDGLSDLVLESKIDDGTGTHDWTTVNIFSNYDTE